MPRSKSDIANSAIRIFLQEVGKFYDERRGLKPFVPSLSQKRELLSIFNSQCCYCGLAIDAGSISLDHLIPMNKAELGLHAWGNVVPCCRPCNSEKQQKHWQDFLGVKADGVDFKDRLGRIQKFQKDIKYDPTLHLDSFANNLYQDVGEVAMTLINLRISQAKDEIDRIVKPVRVSTRR